MEQSADDSLFGQRVQHIGEAIVLIVVAYICASVAISLLDPVVGTLAAAIEGTNVTLIAQTVIQFSVMMAVVVWYARFLDTDQLLPIQRPTGATAGLIVGGTLLLLVCQYAINQLLQLAGFAPGANQAVLAGAGDPTYFLVMVPVSILFVGPAEELLFRGAVQGRLRQSWGMWPAIVSATVLFGLVHIPAITGGFGAQLSYALLVGILGLLLGYLYEYTGNILVPSLIHGAYNATLFGLLYLFEIGAL